MIKIDKKYNVLLTFSPIEEITGHWFEVFEYYVFLKSQNFKPCMLFYSIGIKRETILDAIFEKYNFIDFTDDLIVLSEIDTLIDAHNCTVILTDGNFKSLNNYGIRIISKKMYGFGCGNIEYPTGYYKESEYLLDKRIYNTSYGIHYVKKIYKDILKYPNSSSNTNTALLYTTKNCRDYSLDNIIEISNDGIFDIETNSYIKFSTYIIVSPNSKNISLHNKNIIFLEPPVKNLFSLFSTYVYTPVPRKFDCSPRLICECSLFNKKVLYHNIDYYDKGLSIRKDDLEQNNVWLNDNDEILNIII